MYKIAFICSDNSCLSQIAEALSKIIFDTNVESFSAGVAPKMALDNMAVKALKKTYYVNMLDEQYPKGLNQIPRVDLLISMESNLNIGILSKKKIEWNFSNPKDNKEDKYIEVIKKISDNLFDLKDELGL